MAKPTTSTRRLLAIGFVLMLVFPILQMQWKIVKEHSLGGVEEVAAPPAPSAATWFDGSLAASFSDQLARQIGFRALCVRTVNQTKRWLEPSENNEPINGVVIGKDYWLYETVYLKHYAKPRAVANEAGVRDCVSRLKRLQDQLKARGKAFLIVIAPSKAEFYPNYLPDEVLEQRKKFRGRRYCDALREEFVSQGIHFIDAREILRSQTTISDPQFVRTGTHWSYLACFLVWREALQEINQQLTSKLPVPQITALEHDAPRGTDNDLGDLLNLLVVPGGTPRVAYPVVAVEAMPFNQRPDCLFIGTSFTKTLIDSAYLAKSFRFSDYLYYHQTLRRGSNLDREFHGGEAVKIDTICSVGAPDFAWENVLLDKEVVVLEFLEIHGLSFDFGFCQDALAALEPTETRQRSLERTAERESHKVR